MEEDKAKKLRRILITDISGVLNGSRDRYRMHVFDAEKVEQLLRIVKETGCEVAIAPEMPEDKGLMERLSYARDTLCNYMAAQGLRVFPVLDIHHAFAYVYLAMADSQRETTYCILRTHDTGKQEWGATFGTRVVRAVCGSEIGLTESVANAVISKLNTPVLPEEISMKVRGIEDVKEALTKMGFCPVSLGADTGTEKPEIEKE